MESKKILGFMPLHYGSCYLEACLRSIKPFVDMMHISYVKNPSQGHSTTLINPDKEEELYTIAEKVLGSKLIWESVDSYPSEAHHRERRYTYSEGYDIIWNQDDDEVIEYSEMEKTIEYISNGDSQYYEIKGYKNFFKSFSWYLEDGFRPIRAERLDIKNQKQDLECPLTIYHFSLAQPIEIIKYKFSCFGHASEIRPNYLEDIFYKWTPDSGIKWLHPVSEQIWEKAIWCDKTELPALLQTHPNFNKIVIE